MASIVQRVFAKTGYSAKGAQFVVIDSNGEYGKAFSQLHEVNPDIHVRSLVVTADEQAPDRLEIPVWALTADDWAILLNASERTQLPILQRAIDIARNFFYRGSSNGDIKNHILASSLMGILNSSDTSPSKKDKIVAVLTGFYTDEINSMLDDLSAEVVAKVLAKLLLDYLKGRPEKADMPINFIIEEAHRFVKEEADHGMLGYNIFERIAKEGRKYGFLLGISSQRPSEMSKTIISQCSNFIIHRIQNPDDLQYIARMVPYISEGVIQRLTYLPTGQALVFGTAVHVPMLTRFDRAEPATDSDNAAMSRRWYVK